MFGYSNDELSRLRWQDLTPPEDIGRISRILAGLLSGDESAARFEKRYIRKDGSILWADVATSIRRDEEGAPRYFITSVNDITERKQAEKKQKLLQEQLLQSQKMEAVGRLAGGVAHDFNNLLTVIISFAEMALDKLHKEDPMTGHIREIFKAGEKAAGLTRQLLAFSRKQTMKPEVLDINVILKDIERMISRLIGEDITLIVEYGEDLHKIVADKGQLDQVILNLAINARDAMPHGGKILIRTENILLDESFRNFHRLAKPGEYVLMAFSDTGCGMDEETRRMIFEPFFTTKEQGKGTGLGLSTVYGIVMQSGGFIDVYSEPGAGSVFKIYLPSAQGVSIKHDNEETEDAEAGHGETILVVEDDESVRKLTVDILGDAGYQVIAATGPLMAIDFMEKNGESVDLLLTDILMPGMNAPELIDKIHKIKPNINHLCMSGYPEQVLQLEKILHGQVNFINKPFTRRKLLQKVRATINGRCD